LGNEAHPSLICKGREVKPKSSRKLTKLSKVNSFMKDFGEAHGAIETTLAFSPREFNIMLIQVSQWLSWKMYTVA
jgi:hypothetical protein